MVAILRNKLDNNFHKYFEDGPMGVGQGDLDSSECRLHHVAGAFLHQGWKTGDIKEENVRWIFGPCWGGISIWFSVEGQITHCH